MLPFEIDPQAPLPAYHQLANHMRDRIRTGELAAGARMPSENELMSSLGLARMTVRHAYQLLRDEGLIEAQQGKGVFVRATPPLVRVSSSRFSRAAREASTGAFAAEASQAGRVGRQVLRSIDVVPASMRVAERLKLREGAKVVARRRLMYADDVPMQLADSYYPILLAQGTPLMEVDTGPGGSYSRIEELGHTLVRSVEELLARMPTPEERSTLRLATGVPVVALGRTAYDSDDVPVEFFDSVVAGDKHVFVYDVPMD
jgi:GntR family transcriptional regulator